APMAIQGASLTTQVTSSTSWLSSVMVSVSEIIPPISVACALPANTTSAPRNAANQLIRFRPSIFAPPLSATSLTGTSDFAGGNYTPHPQSSVPARSIIVGGEDHGVPEVVGPSVRLGCSFTGRRPCSDEAEFEVRVQLPVRIPVQLGGETVGGDAGSQRS